MNFMNLQISRTLAKKELGMEYSNKTVSDEAMQAEWAQIQAAQQNPAQFRPLYHRYYDPVFRFIFRRTNQESITADLCSRVFLKALQNLSRYTYKGVPFSAWLFRIASNEVAQYHRDKQKTRVVSLETKHISDLMQEINDAPEEDFRNSLLQALDQLKPKDLELIELRFFEQRPFKEIANILEITESNAKVRTYRILERLKKHMSNPK